VVSVVCGSTLSRCLKLWRSNIPWLCLFSVFFSACPCGLASRGWRWSLILVSMITYCCNKTKVANKRVETVRRPSLGDRFKRPWTGCSMCGSWNCSCTAGAGAAPAEGWPTQVVAAHITYSHVFFSPHLPNGIWLCDMAAQPCSR
jgi:hypothetical protein